MCIFVILCVDETLFYMCEYSDVIKLPKYCVININVYSGDRKSKFKKNNKTTLLNQTNCRISELEILRVKYC
jgi:hypothetical protein